MDDSELFYYMIGRASGGAGGTGTAHVLRGTDEPTAHIGENGDIYLQYQSPRGSLPSGYTRLTTIISSGAQYIDSGVKAKSDVSVEIEFSDYSLSGDTFLFGFRPGSWNGLGVNNGGSGSMWCYYGGNGNAGVLTKMTAGTVKLTNGTTIVNGVTAKTFTPPSFSYDYNIYIFAANNNGTVGYGAKYTFIECKMWEDDVLIRDFVPAERDSDNAIGLYDTVENTFYPNQGSGNFVAGNAEYAILSASAKVNNTWQDLIGTDIQDINL